jgi:4a-hydroxytetrahydrobiopterin dehydratase
MTLAEKKCIPCEDNSIEPLSCDQVQEYFTESAGELTNWKANETCSRITSQRMYPNFVQAMKFVNAVADLAETAGHHPDISVSYNRVDLDLWTHSIGGLSENDFILAAQINKLI